MIVTGNIGDHGISIMCERNNFFQGAVKSDCAYLYPLASIIFEYGDKIKILRDPTRGGVATTLNEFVDGTNYSIEIKEERLPFSEGALGAVSYTHLLRIQIRKKSAVDIWEQQC